MVESTFAPLQTEGGGVDTHLHIHVSRSYLDIQKGVSTFDSYYSTAFSFSSAHSAVLHKMDSIECIGCPGLALLPVGVSTGASRQRGGADHAD